MILKLQSCQKYNCHNYFVFSQCKLHMNNDSCSRLINIIFTKKKKNKIDIIIFINFINMIILF